MLTVWTVPVPPAGAAAAPASGVGAGVAAVAAAVSVVAAAESLLAFSPPPQAANANALSASAKPLKCIAGDPPEDPIVQVCVSGENPSPPTGRPVSLVNLFTSRGDVKGSRTAR